MPLRQHFDGFWINLPVRLEEDGLVRMDVEAIVVVVAQDIALVGDVAVCFERLFLVERGHHHVDLVASVDDQRCQPDFRVDGQFMGHVAAAEADRVVFAAVFIGDARRGVFRVEQNGHANVVGGKDHGLDVRAGVAVGGEADEFHGVGDLVEIQVGPAAVGPVGNKGPAETGVDADEFRVPLPPVAVSQDLADGAHVVTGVVTADNLDIVPLGEERVGVGVAIEDKDKVGGAVQADLNKELDVLAAKPGLGVDVGDEGIVRQDFWCFWWY